MKLVRIEVHDFGRITRADVELGEGLNVLFGPNDLGKSTLARALRLALLLPHGSTAARPYEPWDRDASPRVVVTFQGDDARFWRVDKTFGKGRRGASRLEGSTDGSTFTVEAKGRQVDGVLREKLGWGIASPGGKNAPRGLPESFLTVALLGDQEEAARILLQSFDSDSDDAGRTRLTQALQAFAQDPRFKQVLDSALAKVDEAFSATGKPRKARGAPFVVARDHVSETRASRDRAHEELATAERVQDEGQLLLRALNGASEALAEWSGKVAELRKDAAAAAQWNEAEERCAKSRAVMESVDGEFAACDALNMELEASRVANDEAAKRASAAARELEEAREALEAARAQHREATAEDAERERALRKAELERDRDALRVRVARAQTGEQAAIAHRRAVAACEQTRAELASARQREQEAEAAHAALSLRLAALEQARDAMEQTRLQTRLAEMKAARAQADVLRAQITLKRRDATIREKELADAPSLQMAGDLRDLARRRELAAARCAVGLSVALQLEPGVDLRARVDDRPSETSEVELQADRRIAIELSTTGEAIAELVATAGTAEARSEADRLDNQWVEEGLPRLGDQTLDQFEARAAEAEAGRAEVAERRAEADRLEARVMELRASATDLETVAARLDVLAEQLASHPGVESFSDVAALHDARSEAQAHASASQKELEAARTRRSALEADAAAAEREMELAAASAQPSTQSSADTSEASEHDSSEVLAESLARLDASLEELGKARQQAAAAADAEVERARSKLEEAQRTDAMARKISVEVAESFHQAEGKWNLQRERVGGLDRAAATDTLAEALEAARSIPPAQHDPADLEFAEASLASAKERHVVARQALSKHEGRLELVGGAVARERFDASEDAWIRARLDEREVETEFGGWKLLVETLREAENAEGHHLGEALAAPVSERFSALLKKVGGDAARYGELAFGAMLGTEGLKAAGALQSVGDLSVGTREQIATLLRLTIAQHLHAPLVLDDHLTHTDPVRAKWFRETLREAAHDTQMLVITCHPHMYVDKEDMPDETYRDRAAGLLRTIDATRVIES